MITLKVLSITMLAVMILILYKLLQAKNQIKEQKELIESRLQPELKKISFIPMTKEMITLEGEISIPEEYIDNISDVEIKKSLMNEMGEKIISMMELKKYKELNFNNFYSSPIYHYRGVLRIVNAHGEKNDD